jgi:hypothetical protein
MHIWTDITTIIGDLLSLVTAAINLAAAAIRAQIGHHGRPDGGQKSDGQ